LIRWGVGSGALLVAGTLGLALQPGIILDPPDTLEVLDAQTWTVLAAVAEALCPPSGPSADALDVASRVDRQLGRMHPADAAEVVLVLQLIENSLVGLFFGGGLQPFTKISPDQRKIVLARWQASAVPDLAKGFKAVRGLVVTAYYSHPAAYVASGYAGPPDFGQGAASAIQAMQRGSTPEMVPEDTSQEGVPG
jgi:hypothetical protein